MTEHSPSRKALRQLLIAQRYCFSAAQRELVSQLLADQLVQWCHKHTHDSEVIALYHAYRNEPDLLPWLSALNRAIALPVITALNEPLQFSLWAPGDALCPGVYGIPVPKRTCYVNPIVVTMPCVGTNQNHYRLGYGAGYYDRTIAQLRENKSVQTVGVAYRSSRCVFEVQAHDIAMDACFFA